MLFALSANANAGNLEPILSRLRLLASHSIGCLSSPLPGTPDNVICSIATFPSQHSVPFRSEIPGRAPVQVGRWNRKVSAGTELPDVSQISPNWGNSWEFGKNLDIPGELLGQRDIKSLICFSDNAPEGFMRSLSQFPKVDKLGLVASSTPFITGRPFTLFYNEHIYSSGAVGIALKQHQRPTLATYFHGLIPLSTPVTVSRSEGNLVHELNNSNPSKMLIAAIASDTRLQNMSKDEDFFLGHFDYRVHKLRRIYPILSGGPSRGSIALDAVKAPEENEVVQFFCRAPHSSSTAVESLKLKTENKPSVHFLCSSYDDVPLPDALADEEETVHVLRDTFLAASENGFLCTEASPEGPMWKCIVPGAVGSLLWPDA